MRSYEKVIHEAELLASPPAVVAGLLRNRSAEMRYWSDNDPVDEEAEAALARRDEPLINLALARYARYGETLRPLFEAGVTGGAIRLAILSNRTPSWLPFSCSEKPESLFDDKACAAQWLTSAPAEEICALFENPTLGDNFLADLLSQEKPWDTVPPERLRTFVYLLSRNPRMRESYKERFGDRIIDDGHIQYRYESVFTAAWQLAERVEPTEQWAEALGYLYDCLRTDAFATKEPLALTARWRPDPADTELADRETKLSKDGWLLPPYQAVRKGLGKLALSKRPALLSELLASDDPGLRAAAYAYGYLSIEQLTEAATRGAIVNCGV